MRPLTVLINIVWNSIGEAFTFCPFFSFYILFQQIPSMQLCKHTDIQIKLEVWRLEVHKPDLSLHKKLISVFTFKRRGHYTHEWAPVVQFSHLAWESHLEVRISFPLWLWPVSGRDMMYLVLGIVFKSSLWMMSGQSTTVSGIRNILIFIHSFIH